MFFRYFYAYLLKTVFIPSFSFPFTLYYKFAGGWATEVRAQEELYSNDDQKRTGRKAHESLDASRRRYQEVRPHWTLILAGGGDPRTPVLICSGACAVSAHSAGS
jgi:hypothetical protein